MIRSASQPGFRIVCDGCNSFGPWAANDVEAGRLAQDLGWNVSSVFSRPRFASRDTCPRCAGKEKAATQTAGAVL